MVWLDINIVINIFFVLNIFKFPVFFFFNSRKTSEVTHSPLYNDKRFLKDFLLLKPCHFNLRFFLQCHTNLKVEIIKTNI